MKGMFGLGSAGREEKVTVARVSDRGVGGVGESPEVLIAVNARN